MKRFTCGRCRIGFDISDEPRPMPAEYCPEPGCGLRHSAGGHGGQPIVVTVTRADLGQHIGDWPAHHPHSPERAA